MKEKIIICILSIAVIIVSVIAISNIHPHNEISGDYIAVFHGGSGEITYETYIYKIENDHANMGFKYVNVTSTTTSWGSDEWNHKITKRGKVTWTDDVFEVAKNNGAYSYVTIPNSNKTYTIEEFQKMFLMN